MWGEREVGREGPLSYPTWVVGLNISTLVLENMAHHQLCCVLLNVSVLSLMVNWLMISHIHSHWSCIGIHTPCMSSVQIQLTVSYCSGFCPNKIVIVCPQRKTLSQILTAPSSVFTCRTNSRVWVLFQNRSGSWGWDGECHGKPSSLPHTPQSVCLSTSSFPPSFLSPPLLLFLSSTVPLR